MRAINLTTEAILDEFGQQTAMIDVAMSEKNYIYGTRLKTPMAIELIALFGMPLKHATVEKNFKAAIKLEQVLASSNSLYRTVKG